MTIISKTKIQTITNISWLFNPLSTNISTRGSAESLLVLLPVLTTLFLSVRHSREKTSAPIRDALLSGISHGVSVHTKLYPIIYSLAYIIYLGRHKSGATSITTLIKRVLSSQSITFGVAALSTFAVLTYLTYRLYGFEAIHHSLLYHLGRKDHRHNYSIYWYGIYLSGGSGEESTTFDSLQSFAFLPQIALLIYSAIKFLPADLPFTLFLQTLIFVHFNKVLTGQYFTWYICLLPLCADRINWRRMVPSGIVMVISIVIWLAGGYALEMRGWNVYKELYTASLFFFAASVNLIRNFIRNYEPPLTLKKVD